MEFERAYASKRKTCVMTTAIECPSCGGGTSEKVARFVYRCSYCRNEFKHIDAEEVRQYSVALQSASACKECGDTRNLHVCMFCRQTFCEAHVKRPKDYDFCVCKNCQNNGQGAEFLAADQSEREARSGIAKASSAKMELDALVDSSLTEQYEALRIREMVLTCIKYLAISIAVIFLGSFLHIAWIGVLLLLASVPLGVFLTIRKYEQNESRIKEALRDVGTKKLRSEFDGISSSVGSYRDKIKASIACKERILADILS